MGIFDDFNTLQDDSQPDLIARLQQLANVQSQYSPSAGFPPSPMDSNASAPAPQQPQATPINVGGYSMPRIGPASSFTLPPGQIDPDTGDHVQPAAPNAPAAIPDALQTPAQQNIQGASNPISSFLNKAAAGLHSVAQGGTLYGAVTGHPDDPASLQKQQLQQHYQALIAAGVEPKQALLALLDPEAAKTIIPQALSNKTKFSKIGQDGLGREQYGFVDENNQTVNGAPLSSQPAQDAGGGLGDMSKSGEEYLATLPKSQANIIKQMTSGTMAPPSSFALSKPYWQSMLAAASNYDPEFDATKWTARNAMARSAGGDGKMGQNNNAIVTGIGHLMQLDDAIGGLGNSEKSQTYNRVTNALSTEFGGTGVTNFTAVANRVAPEIVKIWRGVGGAEADIKRDIDSLNSSETPSQLHGAISNIAGMMRSKLESNQQEYRATMGRDLPLTPEQQKTLSMLDKMAAGTSSKATPAATSTLPDKAAVEAEMKRRGLL